MKNKPNNPDVHNRRIADFNNLTVLITGNDTESNSLEEENRRLKSEVNRLEKLVVKQDKLQKFTERLLLGQQEKLNKINNILTQK